MMKTISQMSKKELENYALDKFKVDIDRRDSLKKLQAQVRDLEEKFDNKEELEEEADKETTDSQSCICGGIMDETEYVPKHPGGPYRNYKCDECGRGRTVFLDE